MLPRNVWATGLASFFMDVSSEMVVHVLPLFLANVLGVKTAVIGVIEGVAETMASLLKVSSGWLSDRLRMRKWLAVGGYTISALSKPGFYVATTWGAVALVRWSDRAGKGIRVGPRDALIADSVDPKNRGLAFGFQRAADTAGATVGVLIALAVLWFVQAQDALLGEPAFRFLVVLSLVPAALAVVTLAVGAQDVPVKLHDVPMSRRGRALGRPFAVFMIVVGIFELGNSSDAFLVLRAQERGVSVTGILSMLVVFNVLYAVTAGPVGRLSDRHGRRRVIIGGWLLYAAVYAGFGLAWEVWHVGMLYALYGVYYGLSYGTAKALIADVVPETLRGMAYGIYSAVIGVLDFPASVMAGVLWQGIGIWPGFGASAPFLFGAAMALAAAVMMVVWMPHVMPAHLTSVGNNRT